jgi:mono/diheme cytochrome c family protein
VPAINTPSGGTDLGFPYNIRTMMLGWNLLFFNNKPYEPDTSQSAAWNRGHYLVDALGHCGACHTAKNMLGGDKTYLAGGTLQGWYAPPLDKGTVHGLGSWSQQDLVGYLKNGSNAHAVAIGPMAEEVEHSSQHMPVDDLQAIATYLESLPGHDDDAATPLASDDAQMQRGAHIYVTACSACHTPGGEGIPGMATHLADNPAIRAQDPSSLIHVLMTGAKAAVTGTNPTGAGMPSFAWKLNDADAAAVLTYVRNSWGNAAPAVRARDVAKAREALKAREAM